MMRYKVMSFILDEPFLILGVLFFQAV